MIVYRMAITYQNIHSNSGLKWLLKTGQAYNIIINNIPASLIVFILKQTFEMICSKLVE